jgi:hypothetical protein
MLGKLKNTFGFTKTRPVFVIGTGRSGTHWIGYSLGAHPAVRATVEEKPMFGLVTRMAMDPTLEPELFDPLVRAYKRQLRKTLAPVYLDKSHPNIWLADRLKQVFPDALFLGTQRNPYATVASMMKHLGVSAWHSRWREFPVPNRFLGITADMVADYDALPLATQCAYRWRAHNARMRDLERQLGDDLFVVSYESFAHHPQDTIDAL